MAAKPETLPTYILPKEPSVTPFGNLHFAGAVFNNRRILARQEVISKGNQALAQREGIERDVLRAELATQRLQVRSSYETTIQQLEEAKLNRSSNKRALIGELKTWLLTHDEDLYHTKTGRVRKNEAVIEKLAERKAKKLAGSVSKKGSDHLGLDSSVQVTIESFRQDNTLVRRLSRQRKFFAGESDDLDLWDNYLQKQNWIEHGYQLLQLEKASVQQEVRATLAPEVAQKKALENMGFALLPTHPLLQKIKGAELEMDRIRDAARDEVFNQKVVNPDFAAELHPIFQRLGKVELNIAQAEKLIPREVARGKKSPDALRQKLVTFALANRAFYKLPNQMEKIGPVDLEEYRRNILSLPQVQSNEELHEWAATLKDEYLSWLSERLHDELTQRAVAIAGGTITLGLLLTTLGPEIDKSNQDIKNYEATVRSVNTALAKRTEVAGYTKTATASPTSTRTVSATATQDPNLLVALTQISERITKTALANSTSTFTTTPTPTATRTATATETRTQTSTATPTNSPTETASPSPTLTEKPTFTSIATATVVINNQEREVKVQVAREAVNWAGITQQEIESLRVRLDGRRYSCMEDLGDIIDAFGDLGREVVITMNALEAAESDCKMNAVSGKGSRGRLQASEPHWAQAAWEWFKKPFREVVADRKLDMKLYRKIYEQQGVAAWDPCDINKFKKGYVPWVVNCEKFPNVFLGPASMVVRH